MFLKNKRAIFAYIATTCSMFFLGFYYPIMSLRLKDLGVSKEDTSFYFAIAPFTYVLLCIFVPYFMSKIDRRYITVTSFFLSSIALLMLGPS